MAFLPSTPQQQRGFGQPEPEDPSYFNVPEPGCMASGHSQSLSPWFPGLNSEWADLGNLRASQVLSIVLSVSWGGNLNLFP